MSTSDSKGESQSKPCGSSWVHKMRSLRNRLMKIPSPTPANPGMAAGCDKNQGSGNQPIPSKWSMGILNVPLDQVPGSVFLFDLKQQHNTALQDLADRNLSTTTDTLIQDKKTSLEEKKKTPDGKIILDPQPEDSQNDPLNLPLWRKDAALYSLGLYCMLGGGTTPILAAGFKDVASTYNITLSKVALTTGLYMMGLGVGSVFASPISLIYGKRFVYLCSAVAVTATSCWCAGSPSFKSLLIARTLQGFWLSPVECLPSATISEIFFLHERAHKVGIYALLLVGGKNVVPLVGAMIVQYLGWRWIFWILALLVVFSGSLLFLFVPESQWERKIVKSRDLFSSPRISINERQNINFTGATPSTLNRLSEKTEEKDHDLESTVERKHNESYRASFQSPTLNSAYSGPFRIPETQPIQDPGNLVTLCSAAPMEPVPRSFRSSWNKVFRNENTQDPGSGHTEKVTAGEAAADNLTRPLARDQIKQAERPLNFTSQLRPYHGRLSNENWIKIAIRPFKLYAYPAILWSAAVYSCSVGWLIVLSESVIILFRSKETYGFSPLTIGLIYISPLIGGVLGTAVAGKLSDIIARYMSKKNGGLYEPEFRLLMAVPVLITTVAGLIGIGWSVQEHNTWIVPVTFFGIISFGCSLGVTTAITFCVDSYRQYAVEALVTLNFSKNIFHGLVFSFFITGWIENDGPRKVFMWLGLIQLLLMITTIPMYIFGKKARALTINR